MKPESLRLPLEFDAARLKQDYRAMPQNAFHSLRNPYVEPDTLWSIHLIEPDTTQVGGDPVFVPNTHLRSSPYFHSVLDLLQCQKETFRVHRLDAGAHIRKHRDIGRNIQNGVFRVHIPILTSKEVRTVLNGREVSMDPGSCWYLDFDLPHEIHNDSNEARVHLVVDCLRNDWWDDLFDKAGCPVGDIQDTPDRESIRNVIEELKRQDSEAARQLIRKLKAQL